MVGRIDFWFNQFHDWLLSQFVCFGLGKLPIA